MLRIVSQTIPPDNREIAYRRAVAEARVALERAVAVTVAAGASFAEQERAVLAAAHEACRFGLEARLQATAAAHPEQVRVEGVLYQRHHETTVVYHRLCGPLEVRRATYRAAGERNGPTVAPLELAAGLIEGATPALASRVALGDAQGPGRQAEEQMHADHRQPPVAEHARTLGVKRWAPTRTTRPRGSKRSCGRRKPCPRGRTRSSSASIGPRCRWKSHGWRAWRHRLAVKRGPRRTSARLPRRWT